MIVILKPEDLNFDQEFVINIHLIVSIVERVYFTKFGISSPLCHLTMVPTALRAFRSSAVARESNESAKCQFRIRTRSSECPYLSADVAIILFSPKL